MNLGKDIYTLILSKIDDLNTVYNFALVCKHFAKLSREHFSRLVIRGFDVGEYNPTLNQYGMWEIRRNLRGQRHGLNKQWWPNGNLKLEIMYENGEENGFARCYNRDGSIFSEKLYMNGYCYEEKEYNSTTGLINYWCEWDHGPIKKIPKLVVGQRVKWRR